MEALKAAMQSLPLLIITVGIKYRFAYRALGIRMSKVLTFSIMLVINFLAGCLNMQFHLAKTIGENTFYYCMITFLLYWLLFKGNAIKKLFITIFICCGIPITYYILLPFASCFFGQTPAKFLFALQILEYANTLLSVAIMEYAGRKFQNLQRELPAGYTIYLTAVLLFVQVAVYSQYDAVLARNNGVVPLLSAFITAAFAVVGIAIVIVAVFAVDRQVNLSLKEQLHIMQAENFRIRELEWRRRSSFRHDIKNHLLCLNSLLEHGKTEQAASYMHNLTDTVKQLDNPVQTGNDYADALLSVKYAEAIGADIKISLDMTIPAQDFIDPVDLCCILSNAFDNAIAACKRLTEGEKWIAARAFIKQGQFVMTIKNSKPPYVTVIDGEVFPKEITADHGIGLSTVKTVVEKYSGALNLSAEDAFSFSVLLPQRRL